MTLNVLIRGTKTVVGFGLICTKAIVSLWYDMRTKTNKFGLIGIKAIAGLGPICTNAIGFLW